MKTKQESIPEKALVILEKSEDGYWASIEKLPGCYSFGKTFELQIKYDLQTLFEAFKFINKSAFAQLAGINPSLLRQYTQGIAFASDKQKVKINKAIRSISHNLENACL